ncbi:hypothetical protein EDB86DRAFT_2830489 [Lactarius hatsudake]|nr:hypothetical protein EDB86DRAFT_2830489 [Lactarius hatsudake]
MQPQPGLLPKSCNRNHWSGCPLVWSGFREGVKSASEKIPREVGDTQLLTLSLICSSGYLFKRSLNQPGREREARPGGDSVGGQRKGRGNYSATPKGAPPFLGEPNHREWVNALPLGRRNVDRMSNMKRGAERLSRSCPRFRDLVPCYHAGRKITPKRYLHGDRCIRNEPPPRIDRRDRVPFKRSLKPASLRPGDLRCEGFLWGSTKGRRKLLRDPEGVALVPCRARRDQPSRSYCQRTGLTTYCWGGETLDRRSRTRITFVPIGTCLCLGDRRSDNPRGIDPIGA